MGTLKSYVENKKRLSEKEGKLVTLTPVSPGLVAFTHLLTSLTITVNCAKHKRHVFTILFN